MFDSTKVANFPEKPGVYIMKDKKRKVIYVGKAVSLRNRVRSYFQSPRNQPLKVSKMVSKIDDIEYIVTDNEVEALILECNLIKYHRPKYNILLRDDKQYPYIKITMNEPYPRLLVVRQVKRDGARYFGPYVNSGAMRETIDIIRRVFPIRNCRKDLSNVPINDRPCLNFHIERCLAPCQAKIDEKQYDEIIQNIIMFLEGRQGSLIKILEEKMQRSANNLDFEKAAVLRDQIRALKKTLEKQKIVSTDMKDRDVIAMAQGADIACILVFFIREGKLLERESFILKNTEGVEKKEVLTSFVKQFYNNASFLPKEIIIDKDIGDKKTISKWLREKRGSKVIITIPKRGEKRKLADLVAENAISHLKQYENKRDIKITKKHQALEGLKNYLGLNEVPYRIEAFDISNIQGSNSVASMVVFEDGEPKKQDYRKFKIRTVEGPNDFESMREVIKRRFRRALVGDEKFSKLPELLLIDGGKGQLKYAIYALKELDLEYIPTIAIAEETDHIFMEDEPEPIIMPKDSESLLLLQRIRDEAHRFALSFHRSLRSKKSIHSVLDDIPGVGKVRRLELLKKFGSIHGIKRASIEELAETPSINKKVAKAVYEYFNKE